MSFAGIPVAALDFYDDLELDNTKSFWEARKQTYAEAVRGPMQALAATLEPEFGKAKLFRPYRDVRFSKDKTPYKTHQGLFVQKAPATGLYAEVAAPGFRVGVGFYHAEPARLAAFRTAVDSPAGESLERTLAALEGAGWERGGDRLKTSPRGWDADHPRIDLLRHKTLTLAKHYGFEDWIHTPALADQVAADWREAMPLVTWVTEHTRVEADDVVLREG
ncbi:DUF2461 domain-containing protein [Nocardioidaceae bacterium]|nr:DUF2461 domain-containing protein [Nocardioidaceae bacterium]